MRHWNPVKGLTEITFTAFHKIEVLVRRCRYFGLMAMAIGDAMPAPAPG